MPSRPQNLKAAPISRPSGPSVPIDLTVKWSLSSPFGIQQGPFSADNPFAGVWFSGHLNDVLLLPSGAPPGSPSPGALALLAGADSGGVWNVGGPISVVPTNFDPNSTSPPTPTSQCLSDDWDTPGVQCLCAGPGAQHVYAGTADVLNGNLVGYVYETAAVNGVYDMLQWRAVPNATGALTDFGWVFRILVVGGSPNRIVLATNNGVFWAAIPTPGGNYAWQQVTKMTNGANFPPGAYSGLAAGPNGSVVVAAYGADTATGLFGIFHGDWSTGTLLMTRSAAPAAPPQSLTTFDQGMYRTSLSSCASNLEVIYAISASSGGTIYAILRSQDGGKSWFEPYDQNDTDPTAAPLVYSRFNSGISGSLFVNAGVQGSYNQAIAVSPADKNGLTLAVGWQTGSYVSTDGGSFWELMQGSDLGNQLHSDVHGLYFDPFDSKGQTLYVCSDGGLAVTRDLGATFDSSFNQCLATMQFYSTTSLRDFYGSMSVSGPLLAAGSQDNGDLVCAREGHYYEGIGLPQPAPSPWMKFSVNCDGGPVAFLGTAPPQGNFPVNPPQVSPAVQVLSGAVCHGGQPLFTQNLQPSFMWNLDPGEPVLIKDPGQSDNGNSLIAGIEAVRNAPKIVNSLGQLMYAVAFGWATLSIYGLFAEADGSQAHFEHVGVVQSAVHNDTIGAVATADGATVFVGTSAGRMFKFTVTAGQVAHGQSLPVTLPSGVPQGAVQRIVALSASSAFATYNFGWSGRVLKFNGTSWNITDSVLPGHAYFGLECDDTGGQLFAAADNLVFVSRDGGATWLNCSSGLPKQPHCSDLRFARDSSDTGWLYVSTFGRSVWQAVTDQPPTPPKPVLVPTGVIGG
jgi:hypothetical protein